MLKRVGRLFLSPTTSRPLSPSGHVLTLRGHPHEFCSFSRNFSSKQEGSGNGKEDIQSKADIRKLLSIIVNHEVMAGGHVVEPFRLLESYLTDTLSKPIRYLEPHQKFSPQFPAKGVIYEADNSYRHVIALAVRALDDPSSYTVIFIYDTGSPVTTLTQRAKTTIFGHSLSKPEKDEAAYAEINGVRIPVYESLPGSLYENVNILGADFFHLGKLNFSADARSGYFEFQKPLDS